MATFEISTPDGAKYRVQAPDGVSQQEVLDRVRAVHVSADMQNQPSYIDTAKGLATQLGIGAMKGLEAAAPAAGSFFGPAGQEVVRKGVELADKAIGYPEPSGTGQEFARTTGEFVGNPASYVGGGSVGMKVLQAISSAVGSEGLRQLVKGQGPIAEGVASIAGAVLGGQVPRAGTAPRVLEPKQAANVAELRSFGVEPTAGDVIGNKAVRKFETTLGNAPGSGGAATKADTRIGQQITDAVIREMGSTESIADTPMSKILANAQERIGNKLDEAAVKLPVNRDEQFGNDIGTIFEDMLKEGLPTETYNRISTQIKNVLRGFDPLKKKTATIDARMSGETYQNLTKKGTPLYRDMNSTDPNISHYANRIRDALDDAVDRTANARGTKEGVGRRLYLKDLKDARREYYTRTVLAKAVAGAGEKAAHGIITPAKLRSIIAGTEDQKIQYAFQRSNLARLANAGEAVISKLPDSGTPAGMLALHAPAAIGTAIGSALGSGVAGPSGSIPGAIAGLYAPGLTGRALMSRPVQSAIKKNKLGNAPAAGRSAGAAILNQMGAKQAPDGNYYVPDPNRPGKYLQVVPKRAN